MRFFVSTLKKLGTLVQKLISKSQEKVSNSGSKKIGSPAKIKKISLIVFASFALTIVFITILTKTEFVGKGMEDFQKQKGVKFGVTRVSADNSVNAIDPLANFNAGELTLEQQCTEMQDRLKDGKSLSTDEYTIFKKCLKENVLFSLSDLQKKAFDALANPDSDLSPQAKELMGKVAAGLVDPDSAEAKIAANLLSNDPLKREVANKLLDPNISDEERRLLTSYLDGKVGPEVARGLLNPDPEVRTKAVTLQDLIQKGKHVEAKKAIADLQNYEPKQDNSKSKDNGSQANELEAAKVALEELENDVRKGKEELGNYGTQIKYIENKVAQGNPLTPGETSIYDNYKRKKEEVELLEKTRDQTHADYQRIYSKINMNVGNQYSSYGEENREIIDEYDPRQNLKQEPEIKKTEVVTKVSKVTPSEYELIRSIKSARMSDDYEGSLLPNVSGTTFTTKEMIASASSSGRISPLKNFNLPLDLKVPCVIETELFVSSKDASGRRVICNVLDNVYNPENDEILIPKGSKAIGITSGFDAETKLMQVSFSKVRVGKENFDIGFSLVDGTGRQGLLGGVLRTRNKRVTAAVLTDFAAGVTQFFSQYAQQRMLQNGVGQLNLTNSVTGAAFQGLSTGLTKIAETLTQDLQNSPDIFYSPAGMKMHLIPN